MPKLSTIRRIYTTTIHEVPPKQYGSFLLECLEIIKHHTAESLGKDSHEQLQEEQSRELGDTVEPIEIEITARMEYQDDGSKPYRREGIQLYPSEFVTRKLGNTECTPETAKNTIESLLTSIKNTVSETYNSSDGKIPVPEEKKTIHDRVSSVDIEVGVAIVPLFQHIGISIKYFGMIRTEMGKYLCGQIAISLSGPDIDEQRKIMQLLEEKVLRYYNPHVVRERVEYRVESARTPSME